MTWFWRIWYYFSIFGLFGAGLNYSNAANCLGREIERCTNVSLTDTAMIVALAIANFYLGYRLYKYGHLWQPRPSLKFSWRGERGFPISFIVFFVFGAVFLGEHLPTIIGFLGNHYNAIDSKPSMLDMGASDAGVVYVIYAVFGLILWLLFRFFSWPVILLIGAFLGGLGEIFLFLNEQNPAEDEVSLINALSALIIWGGLISVLPQIIYQNISRRWNGSGRKIAVVVVVSLNLFSFGFLAYQKYGLSRINYAKTGLPVGVCPERLVDKVGESTIVYYQGAPYRKLQPGAYDWIYKNCPGVLERIE